MHFRLRDFAAALAFVALALGLFAFGMGGTSDRGIQFDARDGLVYVQSVAPFSPAADAGVEPGMVVLSAGWNGGYDPRDILPSTAPPAGGFNYLELIWPSDVAAARQSREWETANAKATADPVTGAFPSYIGPAYQGLSVWLGGFDLDRENSLPFVELGVILLLLGIGWFGSGAAGPQLRRMAITLPVAVATPLLLVPWLFIAHPVPAISGAVIQALAMLPLAMDLADRAWPDTPIWQRMAVPVALVALSIAIAAGPFVGFGLVWARILSGAVAAGAPFVPGLFAGWPAFVGAEEGSAPRASRFVEAAELVMVAAAPGVAVLSTVPGFFAWPIVVWVAIFLGVRRFTLRPLARLVNRATIQRDAIVAATEAERARIAADIHDDALQDLTMLIRRLDASGDAENAATAREVAERLRAICGELRLPILDDLGLGPALEWLTERFEPLAGGPVVLARLRDEPRPPRGVELALFRISQEALANAVKHGTPPIAIRYRTGATWAELEVDDSGPGIPAGAAGRAVDAGHFGLLNMAQRAEQVGATLTFGRRPGGGTRVSVVWEAAQAPAVTGSGLGAGSVDPVEPGFEPGAVQ